jgi:para-nitrobenzyl esterase
MTRTLSIALACTMLAGGTVAHAQAVGTAAPVRTQQGEIQGAAGKVAGVTVFKNIPFAAAPVGDLRWRQPQPPQAWQGVRDGSRYGDVCVQNPAPTRFRPTARPIPKTSPE